MKRVLHQIVTAINGSVKMGIIATTDGGAYDSNRKQEIGIICRHSVNELKYV